MWWRELVVVNCCEGREEKEGWETCASSLFLAAGNSRLGGFPAACRQPVSLPGEEEGWDQDVCSPLLQGVADLERRRRKDKVPV